MDCCSKKIYIKERIEKLKEDTKQVLVHLENMVESATEPRIFMGDREQIDRGN
jgi:hypothetical protein